MSEIIFADVNHGVKFQPYDLYRRVCQALYLSLVVAEFFVKLTGKIIDIYLPSDLAIRLFDGSVIPNFVPPEKKFYAVAFSIAGLPSVQIPLIRAVKYNGYEIEQSFTQIWDILIHKVDYHIPDSENWLYHDPLTGFTKLGKDCVPPQSYGILGKGLIDFKAVEIITGIYMILKHLGLMKAAARFLGNLFGFIDRRIIRHNLSEVDDQTDSLEAMVEQVETYVRDNGLTINDVRSRLGVRFSIE